MLFAGNEYHMNFCEASLSEGVLYESTRGQHNVASAERRASMLQKNGTFEQADSQFYSD